MVLGDQIHNYKYTNTQIHKYSLVKFAERPNKCYIFSKEIVPGDQNQYSQVSDMQIYNTNTQLHKYKYTNTIWVKFADTPNMCYIIEKVMVPGPQKQCSWVFITIYENFFLIKQAKITRFGRAEWKWGGNATYKNAIWAGL